MPSLLWPMPCVTPGRPTGPILITGCGTSEHAAMAIAALLNEALEATAGQRDAGQPGARDAAPAARRRASSSPSRTRAEPKLTNEAISTARAAGARTALVTVGSGSPGAGLAELVVTTGEQDQSWCHTIGYLSPLLVGVALAARLRGAKPDIAAVRALLDVTEDARPVADVAAALGGVDRLLVVGTGVDVVTARELALKVAEGARLPTAAHELETLLHGHLAAADRWSGLVLVDTGETLPIAIERAGRVLSAARELRMAAAAILSEERAEQVPAEETPGGRIVLPHTGRVPGVAGSLLSGAIALQLLTERLARARGVNPDTLGREDSAQAAAHR